MIEAPALLAIEHMRDLMQNDAGTKASDASARPARQANRVAARSPVEARSAAVIAPADQKGVGEPAFDLKHSNPGNESPSVLFIAWLKVSTKKWREPAFGARG
jgi:hypothetical protein